MRQMLLQVAIGVLAGAVMACGPREGGGAPPEVEMAVVEIPSTAPGSPETPLVSEEPPPVLLIEELTADEPSPIDLEPVPGAREIIPLDHPEALEPAPAEDPHPVLDDLLRLAPVEEVAPSGPQSVEWAGEREKEKAREAERKARARIEFSRQNVTQGLPTKDERRRTDLGVSVPLDEADRVRVKGGVRVDERELTELEREANATPTVGVEVKF